MAYPHIRTYTDQRLEQLIESHSQPGDGMNTHFLEALMTEQLRRKEAAFVQNFGVDQLLGGEIL